jgi:hypothetical protein
MPATVGEEMSIVTVSLLEGHMVLLTLHTNRYVPGTKLLTDVSGLAGWFIVAVLGPLNWLQLAGPLNATFPFKWIVSFKHIILSAPAFDSVTKGETVITASIGCPVQPNGL